jgi:hypothetical protein
MKHITEWFSIVSKEAPNDIPYYYNRLLNCQFDSLSVDFICIDKLKFPVHFKMNEPPKDIVDPIQRNMHCMLVTTGFPLIPANQMGYIYPFEKVDEPVPLSWLPGLCPRRATKSLPHSCLGDPVIAMRECLNATPFSGVSFFGRHFLIGSFWIETRVTIEQAEFLEAQREFRVMYPRLPVPISECGFTLKYHDPVPAHPSLVQSCPLGVTVFVASGPVVEEYKLKRQNTVDLRVVRGKIDGTEVMMPVEDGVWECSLPDLKPIKRVARLPTISAVKAESLPVLSDKKAFAPISFAIEPTYKLVDGKFYPECREGFHQSRGVWKYRADYQAHEGSECDRKFYFSQFLPPQPNSSVRNVANVQVEDYMMISPTMALCKGGVVVPEIPKPVIRPGTALLLIRGTTVGLVQEGGKLLTLPGGKMEDGEDARAALNRELNEELPMNWGTIRAYGPYQSDLCTYYVREAEVDLKITFASPYNPSVSPWVRRVYEHYLSLSGNDKLAPINRFVESHTFPKMMECEDTLKLYLRKPRTLVQLYAKFGTNWRTLDVPMVCLGNLVYSREEAIRSQLTYLKITDRVHQQMAEIILPLLPATFQAIVAKTGFSNFDVSVCLQSMPVTYDFQAGLWTAVQV